MEVTYERGTEEYIASAFGWTTNEEGIIVDGKSKEPVPATDGEEINIRNLDAVVDTPPTPKRE